MNCGFEDVRLLQTFLKQHPDSLGDALIAYSESRRPALDAIQKLAFDNYKEMASKVVDPLFLFRKKIDNLLTRVLGESIWCPLYTMVTFRPEIMYDDVVKRSEWQKRTVDYAASGIAAIGLAFAGLAVYKRFSR